MRIITQNGYGDIPYGSTILAIEDCGYDFRILGYSQHYGDKVILIASYKTKEKAKKAMDLLHETYVGKMFLSVNENVEFDNTAKELLKNATILCTPNVDVRPIGDSRNVVFRFPADDEI